MALALTSKVKSLALASKVKSLALEYKSLTLALTPSLAVGLAFDKPMPT